MTDETRTMRETVKDMSNRPSEYVWRSWNGDAAPEPGDEVPMSSFVPVAVHPDSGYHTVYPREDDVIFYAVPVTAWGDYSGSVVERSNCRSIFRDYPQYVVRTYGDYGSEMLFIRADLPLEESFADGLRALADEYPVWDESDLSELEMELQTEALEEYGLDELREELCKILNPRDGGAAEMLEPCDLAEMYWQACSDDEIPYPECETATDIILNIEEAARVLAEHIIAAWQAPAAQPKDQLTLI